MVAKYPNIKIVQKQTAKFTRNDAVDVVSNWMTSGEDIRPSPPTTMKWRSAPCRRWAKPEPYSHRRRGWHPGRAADAEERQDDRHHLPGCERRGEGAVDAAIKLANGEKVEKIIDVPYQLITKENMAEFTNRNQK